MMRVTFCGECGVRANPHKDRCHLCGGRLPHSKEIIKNPGVYAKMAQERPKAVIFDLDMTIFNNSQRFTDARRAGLVDKDGKAVAKGMMSTGQAWRKRNKFIYSDKALAKDTVIPGAKELISDLSNDGYVIVYLTARPEQYYEASLKQLESNGFPLYRDKNGKTLLITKPVKSSHTAKYKANAARELSGEFKIEMVFDDDKKVLEEMAKLRIPGLYASISDHVKTNPNHPEKPGMDGLTDDGNWPSSHKTKEEEEDEGQLTLADFVNSIDRNPGLPNPLPKPKRKKLKTGKFRKEPARKYLSRLMGIPKMREEFPDSKQRFAVAIGLVKKYYNAETANRIAPRANPWRFDTDGYRHAAGALIMEGDKVLLLRRSAKETSRHGMWELPGGKLEEGESPEEAALNETKEESGLEVTISHKVGEHVDHNMNKIYHGFIVEPVNVNQEIKLSEEHDESLWVTLEEALAMEPGKLSHHARHFFEQLNVKENPADKKKIERGKKLYKHMNGKAPAKQRVEKIDIGDVWYKVGEGGCWQIGYMSGKETGQENQKYVHTFNEETQDGNFPELYATMPEKGKPMLIIKGGTWKIKTDDQGVAWIYD
tara:strand:- start:948 stop:2738 length:1791 start_codon:yes stop_codon:yes gene_type:complete